MLYGKVPPQAKDLEEAILGAILMNRSAIDQATEILTPQCFYLESHQIIFSAMIQMAASSKPIDVLTVTEEIRRMEKLDIIGGQYYLEKLTGTVVSDHHIARHSHIVLEKFLAREIIRIGGEMIYSGYEDATDVFELIDQVEASVMAVTTSHLKKDYHSIDGELIKFFQRVEDLRHKDSSLTGITSGYKEVDKITHGWQNTDLIILAARPAVGKTAFAINLARNAALDPFNPVPVGFFSLEMSRAQLVQRMTSAESEIDLKKIQTGKLDEAGMRRLYQYGVQKLAAAPIFIDDTAALNMFELRAKARRMKNKDGVGMIIIDYLQLMTGDSNKSENREREISKISRELKKLAKDLEIPIIALSQLSRAVEQRGKGMKVPQLSDLRESGAIEQDADLVMFLYRPPAEEVKEDPELRGKGMLRIAKHRSGNLDEVVFKFYGEIQKWMDMEQAAKYDGGMGSNWKQVTIPGNTKDYSEPTKKSNDVEEELPF